VRPAGTIAVRETVPEKPLKLIDVSVEVAHESGLVVRLEGFAET